MNNFFTSMGTWALPLFIIAIAILVLSIKKVADLYFRKNLTACEMAKGLHAIIFWGGMTAVVGFLGQLSGMYNAMQVISRASAISPQKIAIGFGESLTTTIFGLQVLIVSGIIWFILLNRYNKLLERLK
jgi:hypothetical protein